MDDQKKSFQVKYKKYFDEHVKEFSSEIDSWIECKQNFVDRLNLLIDYNCHGGKNIRAFSLTTMAEKLCEIKKIPLDENMERDIYALACCIEILQASLLVADDIADNSSMRRGKLCWYRREDVQMDSVNDAFILESFVYFILKKTFSTREIYIQLVDIYHEVALRTQIGQLIDLSFKAKDKSHHEMARRFSKKTYKTIIVQKTAYYTYFIPISNALILCGMNSDKHIKMAQRVAVKLGQKFQIEDDFIDCYAVYEKSGKIGKDIEEKKCTWLIVNAIERANGDQLETIWKHYGVESEKSRDEIKRIYDELELKDLYLKQEVESFAKIKKYIEENDETIPSEALMPLLDQIHMRSH